MSAVNIIFVLAGITVLVLLIILTGQALESRKARRLALPILGRLCPFCGASFRPEVIRCARLETAFDGPSYPSVICTGCSRRWALIDSNLVEQPV